VGNRLRSLGVSPYSYDNSNRVNSQPGASYSYDANGNLASKSDPNGTTSYAWDFENRVASVTLPGSGGTVTFQYDPFGRRSEKILPGGRKHSGNHPCTFLRPTCRPARFRASRKT